MKREPKLVLKTEYLMRDGDGFVKWKKEIVYVPDVIRVSEIDRDNGEVLCHTDFRSDYQAQAYVYGMEHFGYAAAEEHIKKGGTE